MSFEGYAIFGSFLFAKLVGSEALKRKAWAPFTVRPTLRVLK